MAMVDFLAPDCECGHAQSDHEDDAGECECRDCRCERYVPEE